MSKDIRQGNLYGAEDWSLVYTSFKNANFTSYDFDTLRQSMVDYMQVNYAEEYNDYIQSSEFVALLDLVAYVGQNLSFRMDLNARENILDTAEKRESVLRIARMLSYKPKRVRPAQGLLKVTSVLTTENILDSTGVDLSNQVIPWGSDPSELGYERFIRVLNSAFDSNNQFGTPVNRVVNATSSDIFEIYNFNNSNPIINYPVSAIADGSNLNFDLLPVIIDSNGNIAQAEPDYNASFSAMYRNDGKGVGSTKTGFFILAKQGYTVSKDIALLSPQSNYVQDLESTSAISEDDFVVQTVDSTGAIIKTWSRVGALDFTNIVINNTGNNVRDLYEVIYSDADITSIKFGDGNFANAPSGNIKIWYRIAENNYIRVKAGELSAVRFSINYKNSAGESHILTMILDLQDNMTTGIPAETVAEIKNNAPNTFYSKNRMVTGDDYNGLLPTLNNDVLIMKSENRTFSGHSRYVDLKDPTGKGRPLVEIADDGYFYKEELLKDTFIGDLATRRTLDLLDEFVEKELSDVRLLNFYYGKLDVNHTNASSLFPLIVAANPTDYKWQVSYSDSNSSNGYIYAVDDLGNKIVQRIGVYSLGFLKGLRPNAILKMYAPDSNSYVWAAVNDVRGDGLGIEDITGTNTGLLSNGNGPIEINKSIRTNYSVREIIPPFTRVFDDETRTKLINLLNTKQSFALAFDNQTPQWTVITTTVNAKADFDRANTATSWLINVTRDNEKDGWNISTRQLNYVFGSDELIRFYNINFAPNFNINFERVSKDNINILEANSAGKVLPTYQFRIGGYYVYNEGFTDNSKVKVTPLDLDNNFLPDNPEVFEKIVGSDTIDLIEYKQGTFSYLVPSITGDETVIKTVPGTRNLMFKWSHYVESDQTLNPSLTNIIDSYVLTKTYNSEFSTWKKANNSEASAPLPPTSEELRSSFRGLESYKMLTDEVIFHPVSFKPLFGSLADAQFRAQFKVVKSPRSKLTDNELKTKVISAIDTFFTPGNFDFGETFYFTELAAYIHTSLSSDLSSVVLVPISSDSKFGTLFEITPNNNEVVTSVATVNDVVVITELTNTNIRIGT